MQYNSDKLEGYKSIQNTLKYFINQILPSFPIIGFYSGICTLKNIFIT